MLRRKPKKKLTVKQQNAGRICLARKNTLFLEKRQLSYIEEDITAIQDELKKLQEKIERTQKQIEQFTDRIKKQFFLYQQKKPAYGEILPWAKKSKIINVKRYSDEVRLLENDLIFFRQRLRFLQNYYDNLIIETTLKRFDILQRATQLNPTLEALYYEDRMLLKEQKAMQSSKKSFSK